MALRPLYRWATIGLAAALLAGCAARQSRTATSHDARVAAPVPGAAVQGSLSDYMQKIRHLSANARPLNKNEAVETLETRDPAIAAELLLVSNEPTADRYRSLAERYRERGVLDAAYRNFNRALVLNPRDGTTYEGLARVWRDWGLPALALSDAHRAIYYAPRSASARNTYGTVMQALGRYDDARNAYELATVLDARGAYAFNNLCYLAFLNGQADAAVDACRKAIALDPSLTTARNNLALAYAGGGRADLAHSQFADLGDRASAAYNSGIVYLALGDMTSALNAFDEASKARPTFHLARERARQIRAQMFLADHQQRLNAAGAAPERLKGASER